MKHYDSIPRIQDDGTLLGEMVWAYNKLDGQNLCVKYTPKAGFTDFGSRKCNVGEDDEMFGGAVRWFKARYDELLKGVIKENSGKRGYFNGAKEITFYFEWYGDHSFAGFHDPGDELRLALIDVAVSKKGYIEPKTFQEIFGGVPGLEIPELIYRGPLTKEFIRDIQENDWTVPGCKYPTVKEGVVCRRSTLMKGQRMPKVKFKTTWWLRELHAKYAPELWKEME